MQVSHPTSTSPQIELSSISRPIFHRARVACQVCRVKKIRCDVSGKDGEKCFNCVLDNIECIMIPKKPRRNTRTTRPVLPAVMPAPSLSSRAVNCDLRPTSFHQDQVEMTSEGNGLQGLADDDDERSRQDSVPMELPWTRGGPEHRQIYSSTVRSLSPLHSPPQLRALITDLPHYIKPLSSRLDVDDIEYLQKKDAFSLPGPALMDECLRCYALYMHPLYPAVDFIQIWSTVHASSPSKDRLSLLLLQAVVFAGSMWADVRLIRCAGFLTRRAFRHSVNQKIRVLYDADAEHDRFVIVQSLLLWSFWWKGANEQKDGWHWLGVAHSIARSIDLHHSTPDDARAGQRLRTQLWWALYNREVIGSYGIGRQPRIKDSDHTVPLLQRHDFDYGEMMPDVPPDTPRPTQAQHLVLSRINVEFVKLNRILGRILSVVHREETTVRTAGPSSNHISSAAKQSNVNDLELCVQELTSWRQQVPEDLWHKGRLPFDPPEWRKAELSHRALLYMMYHTALMAIHQSQLLPGDSSGITAPSPTGTSERNKKHASRVRIRHSAHEITSALMDFFTADLLTYLPATVVSFLMPVGIRHALDVFSQDAAIRSEASRQLDECRIMLYTLAERQFTPIWVLQTMDHILSRAKQKQSSDSALRSADQDTGPSHNALSHFTHYRASSSNKNGGLNGIFEPNSTSAAEQTTTSLDLSAPNANPLADCSTEATLQQPTVAALTRPSSTGPPAWASMFLDNNQQDQWENFQPSLLEGLPPYFSLNIGNSATTPEESWLELARLSETVFPGSNWPTGTF